MPKPPFPTKTWCCYCKRPLTPAEPVCSTSFTLDHVRAESHGGWKRVPCCSKCNLLKADLPPADWFWFIGAFKRWWKTFDTPAQVLDQVRAEYRRRAYANREMKEKLA